MSGEEISALAEDSVSHIITDKKEQLDRENSTYNWYLQFSGITIRADASAPSGQRILNIKVSNKDQETLLEDSSYYLVALTQDFADKEGIPYRDAGADLLDCTESYLRSQEEITIPDGNRIYVIAARTRELISYMPVEAIILITLLVGFSRFWWKRREEKYLHAESTIREKGIS